MHSPNDVNISLEHAIEYVRDVGIAIYHLLNLLFPNDKLILDVCKYDFGMIPCPHCKILIDRHEKKCFSCKNAL